VRRRRRRVKTKASDFNGLAFSKGILHRAACEEELTEAEKARRRQVRRWVIAREKGECRCCRELFGRMTAIQSMHEVRPRSIGGEISLENSIGVCGSGTTGCHGELQANRIRCEKLTPAGAEGPLRFFKEAA
jgi:hypothetical protein